MRDMNIVPCRPIKWLVWSQFSAWSDHYSAHSSRSRAPARMPNSRNQAKNTFRWKTRQRATYWPNKKIPTSIYAYSQPGPSLSSWAFASGAHWLGKLFTILLKENCEKQRFRAVFCRFLRNAMFVWPELLERDGTMLDRCYVKVWAKSTAPISKYVGAIQPNRGRRKIFFFFTFFP